MLHEGAWSILSWDTARAVPQGAGTATLHPREMGWGIRRGVTSSKAQPRASKTHRDRVGPAA